MCDEKVDFKRQPLMTSSVGDKKNSQTSLKPNLHLKGHGHCLVWPTTAFLIPMAPYLPENVLSKSMRSPKLQYLQSALEQRAQCSMTAPDCKSQSWMNWVTKFCLILRIYLTSCQRTTISSSISTTFSQENATTSRRQKMLFKTSLNPEASVLE